MTISNDEWAWPKQGIATVEGKNYIPIDTDWFHQMGGYFHFFTGNFIEGPYGSISVWIFKKEVNDYWEFVLGTHSFSKFELIKLEITVKGFDDDTGLYIVRSTVGILGKRNIFLIPKF